MFARLLAACCLFSASVFAGSSDSIEPNLAVYLKTAANQSNLTLRWMQRELSRIMLQAGYVIEWRELRAQGQTYADAPNLAVVELRGMCSLPPGELPLASPDEDREPLASTSEIQGHVLPFSTVNCDAVTRLLGPSFAAETGARRDFVYGRALARIVAHELYHVLTGREGHDRVGIAKARFTARDLLCERLEFQETTLAKLKPLPAATRSSAFDR